MRNEGCFTEFVICFIRVYARDNHPRTSLDELRMPCNNESVTADEGAGTITAQQKLKEEYNVHNVRLHLCDTSHWIARMRYAYLP